MMQKRNCIHLGDNYSVYNHDVLGSYGGEGWVAVNHCTTSYGICFFLLKKKRTHTTFT